MEMTTGTTTVTGPTTVRTTALVPSPVYPPVPPPKEDKVKELAQKAVEFVLTEPGKALAVSLVGGAILGQLAHMIFVHWRPPRPQRPKPRPTTSQTTGRRWHKSFTIDIE